MTVHNSAKKFNLLQTEYLHLGIFAPIVLIAGILCAIQEISFWVIVIVIGLGVLLYQIPIARKISFLFLWFVLGFGAMTYREGQMQIPVLERPIQVDVQGVVIESHQTPTGQKLVLGEVVFLNRPDIRIPDKIKLSVPFGIDPISVQTKMSAQVFLRPPLLPIDAFGYNESKSLRFAGIGAVGQVQKIIRREEIAPPPWIEKVRTKIAKCIQQSVPLEVAEVLIPLSIGDQSIVSERIYDLFRSGGITHILSVSGFHLSLLAFFIFLIVRRVLAFFPLSESFSTKKIATVLALLGTSGYILISGMQVPAVRSWIMIVLVLIALLFDRNVISVRSLAVAAIILLILRPELILNISFQLSFMAVLILTTLYQPIRQFIFQNKTDSFVWRFIRGVVGFILIDFLISLATTPFIIYHFNRYAMYSSVGNVLMGTLISFWVMPLLFLGVLVMPLGWEVPFLKCAGLGVEYMIALCDHISHWPYSIIIFPSFSGKALAIMALGIILLCLMKTKLRWMGLGVLVIGVGVAICSPRPDILIGDRGATIALRSEKGLSFVAKGTGDYIAQSWLMHNGENPYQKIPEMKRPNFITLKGYKIAFNDEGCSDADICFLDGKRSLSEKVFPLNDFAVKLIYLTPKKAHIIHLENRPYTQEVLKK